MSKEMEKLVEKIAKKIWAIHAFPRGETDWDRAVKQAEHLIALTLSAVRDGRVKIPGEYWRGRGDLLLNMTVDFDLNATGQIIALRVLTGTSKEEKQ